MMRILAIVFVALAALAIPVRVEAQIDETPLINIDSLDVGRLPTVSRYYFAHQYLSVVTPQVAEADGDGVFLTADNLNTLTPCWNGFLSPYADSDITIEAFEHDGHKIYVWRFPEPQHLREPLYIAFFPVDGHYKAVAISIGQYVDWEISVSDASMRQTFGRVPRPESARECMELLLEHGAMRAMFDPGEFFQDDYVCPEPDY